MAGIGTIVAMIKPLGNKTDQEIAQIEEDVTDVKTAIHGMDMKGELLSDPVKSAIINLFSHVVYVDDEAQTYIQALQQAWANKGTLFTA